jgi:hypothetical protein
MDSCSTSKSILTLFQLQHLMVRENAHEKENRNDLAQAVTFIKVICRYFPGDAMRKGIPE